MFVIVIEILDETTDIDQLETCLEDNYDTGKPIIVSLEFAQNCADNVIYCKEASEKQFRRIAPIINETSLQEIMEDGFNALFDFEMILEMLRSNFGGNYNGKFAETLIDTHLNFGEMRFIDLAAHSNSILCLRFLRLFEFDLSANSAENRKLFEIASRSCDYQGFLALLDLPQGCNINTFIHSINSFSILHPQNAKNFNLLIIASESGNTEALNFLLKCNYDINQQRDLNETAAGIAWRKGHYDVFLRLIKENSLFPDNFADKLKRQKDPGKVKAVLTFIVALKTFHEAIKRGNVDQVKIFLSSNPTMKYAYNMRNESAAAIALRAEQFGIYEFLISQGVCLGPSEDIGEILKREQETNHLDDRRTMMKKMILHETHKKYFKKPYDNHLMTLLAHSDVGFDVDDSDRRQFFKFIKEAYEILNEIEEVSWILKIVSKARMFRVVFDFNRDSVNFLDPTTSRKTKGTSYFISGYVYVGAKGLLHEESKHEVLGTLAHELTHFAMHLVYNNKCKPYRENDYSKIQEFQTVAIMCELSKAEESKIFYVFNYPDEQQHAELIVRVPHLLVLYKNDVNKLEKCRDTYKKLFNFYQCRTLIDLQNEYPMMIAKREIAELNDWLGVIQPLLDLNIMLKPDFLSTDLNASSRIVLLITNCIKLAVTSIHQQLRRDMKTKVENFYMFARPSSFENAKLKGLLLKAMCLMTKPVIVFECDDNVAVTELEAIVDVLKSTERIVFVVKDLGDGRFESTNYYTVRTEYVWYDFTSESHKVLWNHKVTFQGLDLQLKDVMSIPSLAFGKEIPFCDLLGLRLKISQPLKFNKDIDFFLERKFMKQSQQFTFDSLTDHAAEHKIVLVSDDPGAGKTTTFKMLAMRLKELFPKRWVAYVDLKQFIDVFEQIELKACVSGEDVSRFLAEKIFRLNRFELELFCQLFANDRLILFMDGIDEVCPNFKDIIIELLKALKEFSNNQLWISTRPHLTRDLRDALCQEAFHLKPFTLMEQRKFYYTFYENQNVSSDDIDRYVLGIEKLMSFLNKNRLYWSTITSEISSNPLFMKIVAEIYDDDVMQSRGGKCLTALCNLYVMYDRFVARKFDLWMCSKGRLSINDQIEIHRDSKSIMQCHLKFALERTFKDNKVKFFCNETQLKNEQITRIGLMTSDGSELEFMHRSFAEFFVADFLFKQIFYHEFLSPKCRRNSPKERRMVMKLFVKVLTCKEHQMIRAFLGNAFELEKTKRDPKKFSKLAKLFRNESKQIDRDKILTVAVSDGCVNLATIVMEFSLVGQCVLIKLINKEKRNLENVLANAVQMHKTNVETIRTLWAAAGTVYSPKDFRNFFMKVNENENTLLHIIAPWAVPDLLEFLLAEVKAVTNEHELQKFLTLADANKQNAFHIAAFYNQDKSVEAMWKFYQDALPESEQKGLLANMIDPKFSMLRTIIENNENTFAAFWKIFKTKFSQSEVKEMLRTETDGMTILHWAARGRNDNALKNFIIILQETLTSDELKNLVRKQNESNKFVYGRSSSSDTSESKLKSAEQYLTNDDLRGYLIENNLLDP